MIIDETNRCTHLKCGGFGRNMVINSFLSSLKKNPWNHIQTHSSLSPLNHSLLNVDFSLFGEQDLMIYPCKRCVSNLDFSYYLFWHVFASHGVTKSPKMLSFICFVFVVVFVCWVLMGAIHSWILHKNVMGAFCQQRNKMFDF